MHSSETIVTISSNLAQSQPISNIPTQVLGIPMGSPNASPCSIWLFMSWMGERKFPNSLSHSISCYSFSLQDPLEGFIQVLLHFNSLGYPLKMVAKACFKMESKQELKNGYFLGKWVRFTIKRLK